MSSFHDVLFPPKIAYGASGGPGFSTSIATTVSGFEQRNINWRTSRCRWDVSTGIRNESDMQQVIAFFRARFGKAFGFRFKDWTDFRAIGQLIGVGGVDQYGKGITEFELVKEYKSGSSTYSRRILKPVKDTIKVYVDSKEVISSETTYTADLANGIIRFQKPPKKGCLVTCDFEFDVPARFDIDQIVVRACGPNNFVSDSISITELYG